jgi:hypothetical protein
MTNIIGDAPATYDPLAPGMGTELPDPPLSTGPLDVLGTIYDMPPLDAHGKPTAAPKALPGWHVNSPWPIAGWQAWHVTPSNPRRVFGGGVTVHYTFADEAEFLAALRKADLSEPLPPPDPKLVGIDFSGVKCSATRDDQNGLVAVIAAYQLAPSRFTPTVFQFSNGNQLTLTKDNLMPFVAAWMPFRQSFFKPTP